MEDEHYDYRDTFLELTIELNNDNRVVLGFGDYGHYIQCRYEGEWYLEDQEAEKILLNYWRNIEKRDNTESYIYSVERMIEENEEIPDSDLLECKIAITNYIRDYPFDKEFLFYYACTSLKLLTFESADPFETKSIITEIIDKGLMDEFLSYLRKENLDDKLEGYYLDLVANVLKLQREVVEK